MSHAADFRAALEALCAHYTKNLTAREIGQELSSRATSFFGTINDLEADAQRAEFARRVADGRCIRPR